MSDDNVIKLGGKSDGNNKNEEVCCSFCGRSNEEVLKMVKGPGVNICSECVMIAVQYLILQDRMHKKFSMLSGIKIKDEVL